MVIKKIKRKLLLKISKSNSLKFLLPVLERINFLIFHFDERMHMTHPGKEDQDKIYYVIRPRSVQDGLLSSYFFVMDNIYYAQRNGYIAYVDFDSDSCQYHISNEVRGTTNAWEYFFEQPSKITKKELKKKKNVLLSGWSFKKKIPELSKKYNSPGYKLTGKVCRKYGEVNSFVKKLAEERYENLFESKEVLGIFIRGTDYVSLRPKGHPVQPNVQDVISKANEVIKKYNIKNVFLVTEDYSYLSKFKEDLLVNFKCSDDDFVRNYDNKDYISENFNDNPYVRGLNYLIRLIVLSKCQYCVSSITNGSVYSFLIREDECKYKYIFDLGFY